MIPDNPLFKAPFFLLCNFPGRYAKGNYAPDPFPVGDEMIRLPLSDAKIAALGTLAERSGSLEFQPPQAAVDSLVVFTEDSGQLRAAQLRKGSAVRA